jgi:hypothetical protein
LWSTDGTVNGTLFLAQIPSKVVSAKGKKTNNIFYFVTANKLWQTNFSPEKTSIIGSLNIYNIHDNSYEIFNGNHFIATLDSVSVYNENEKRFIAIILKAKLNTFARDLRHIIATENNLYAISQTYEPDPNAYIFRIQENSGIYSYSQIPSEITNGILFFPFKNHLIVNTFNATWSITNDQKWQKLSEGFQTYFENKGDFFYYGAFYRLYQSDGNPDGTQNLNTKSKDDGVGANEGADLYDAARDFKLSSAALYFTCTTSSNVDIVWRLFNGKPTGLFQFSKSSKNVSPQNHVERIFAWGNDNLIVIDGTQILNFNYSQTTYPMSLTSVLKAEYNIDHLDFITYFDNKLYFTASSGAKLVKFNFEEAFKITSIIEDSLIAPTFFPNPANTELTVTVPKPGLIFVHDLTGACVLQVDAYDQIQKLNTSKLPSGMYVLRYHSSKSNGNKPFIAKFTIFR